MVIPFRKQKRKQDLGPLSEGVVLRAANDNANDRRWRSYHNSIGTAQAVTGGVSYLNQDTPSDLAIARPPPSEREARLFCGCVLTKVDNHKGSIRFLD